MQNFTFGRYFGIGCGMCIATIALYSLGTSEPSPHQTQQEVFLPLTEMFDANSPTPAVLPANQATQTAFAVEPSENRVQYSVIEELPPQDSVSGDALPAGSLAKASDSKTPPQAPDDQDLWSLIVSEDAKTTTRSRQSDSVVGNADSRTERNTLTDDRSALVTDEDWQQLKLADARIAKLNRLKEVSTGGTPTKWQSNPHTTQGDDVLPLPAPPESAAEPLVRRPATDATDAKKQSVSSLLSENELSSPSSFLTFGLVSNTPQLHQPSHDNLSSELPRGADRLDSLSDSAPSLSDPYEIAPQDLAISDAVAQRAVHHIEYGKSLARRGAAFAARQEFYSALQVIAHANDGKNGSHAHTAALRNAIMALKEAEKFVVKDVESQVGKSVAEVIETHRSGLLTKEEAKYMTPVEAMQIYFSFAQEQFGLAGGHHVVSAEALFCLGKLHSVMEQHEPGSGRLETAKAIVYHRAALNNDQNNFRSAGELGVLMARMGQLEDAKALFKQSLRIQSTPQAWENLAKVHERLGETNLAQLAQSEQMTAYQMTNATSISWKSPNRFNAEAPTEFHESIASKPTEAATPATFSEDQKESKSISVKLKELF